MPHVAPQRIGLFGGTFDPPHVAHALVAAEVRDQLTLDQVVLMVANDPWQKRDRTLTPAAVRVAMARAAVAGIEGVTVSDREVRRGGVTYTIDTVEELLADGTAEVVLVVGADAAARLDTWHRASELAQLVRVAVVPRPGTTPPELAACWRSSVVSVPLVEVSSTELRRRVAAGRSTQVLVAPGVRAIIDRECLYRSAP